MREAGSAYAERRNEHRADGGCEVSAYAGSRKRLCGKQEALMREGDSHVRSFINKSD